MDTMNYNPADNIRIDTQSDYYVGDIKTAQEADDARAQLQIDCTLIRAQLDEAAEYYRVNKYHRDFSWMKRAKMALAFKSMAMQRLAKMAADMRKEERRSAARDYDKRLIMALRQHVGDDVFMQIALEVRDEAPND